MLNRLKEITLLKVKFPLRCKLHYFASLFFFFSSSVLSRLSLFGTKRNANTNTLN